ncbi:MAG TPA: hypothetical protein VJ756_02105 [Terriglobales bacterium]|nr:hypothetical protein [Terriglobales bacterium]
MSGQMEQQATARLDLARHVADYLAEVDPNGLAVLTLELVDRLRTVNTDAYARLNAGVVAHALGRGALLDRPGSFREALANLKRELAEGNAGQASAIADSMGQWMEFIEAMANGLTLGHASKVQVM